MIPTPGDPEGAGREGDVGTTSDRMTLSAHLIGQEGSHAFSVAAQPGPRISDRFRRTHASPKAFGAADDSDGAATTSRKHRGRRTAAQRRKVNVGSAAAGPTAKLTDLPLTLVATIVELVGPTAALALSRSCRVTCSTRAALEETVAREIDERRMVLAQQRLSLYLRNRCRLLDINNEPSAPVVNEFLPEDELVLIVDQAITSEAKSRLREQWLKQHASSIVDSANFAAVQKLPAYLSAQPDDEPAFLEQLAQSRAAIPADIRAALESEEALLGKPDCHRVAVLRDIVNAAVELASLTSEATVAVPDKAKTLMCSEYVDVGATWADSTDYGVFDWLLSSPPPPESVLSKYPELLRQVKPPQPVDDTTNPAGSSSSSSSSSSSLSKHCTNCGTSTTPMWHKGPLGAAWLCNMCGVYSRQEYMLVGRLHDADAPPIATTTTTAGPTPSMSSARLTPPPAASVLRDFLCADILAVQGLIRTAEVDAHQMLNLAAASGHVFVAEFIMTRLGVDVDKYYDGYNLLAFALDTLEFTGKKAFTRSMGHVVGDVERMMLECKLQSDIDSFRRISRLDVAPESFTNTAHMQWWLCKFTKEAMNRLISKMIIPNPEPERYWLGRVTSLLSLTHGGRASARDTLDYFFLDAGREYDYGPWAQLALQIALSLVRVKTRLPLVFGPDAAVPETTEFFAARRFIWPANLDAAGKFTKVTALYLAVLHFIRILLTEY
ncbi:hypothetical protein HK405_007599, partial [Cladochytrium tenue]